MYQIRAWVKDSGSAVRYIREGLNTLEEVLDCIKEELINLEVIEISIFQRL